MLIIPYIIRVTKADLEELRKQLVTAQQNLTETRKKCQEQRLILAHLESELVTDKEIVSVLVEDLRIETERQNFDSVIDFKRLKEIERFKNKKLK